MKSAPARLWKVKLIVWTRVSSTRNKRLTQTPIREDRFCSGSKQHYAHSIYQQDNASTHITSHHILLVQTVTWLPPYHVFDCYMHTPNLLESFSHRSTAPLGSPPFASTPMVKIVHTMVSFTKKVNDKRFMHTAISYIFFRLYSS